MALDLSRRLRRPALTLVAPIILVGLAGTAVAINDRTSDLQFVARQQNLSAVKPAQLGHLMTLAPNPRPGLGSPKATTAACAPQGSGELQNPWTCVVRYVRGGPVHYTATISPDGHVRAVDPSGILVKGCCVGPHPASQ
ncbi:MAG TPA: hypothetical protein VG253_06135 [Streptosporangiaceae bacterium]|nr:hypothetical protein [Streptosporangiaceae bacterium]